VSRNGVGEGQERFRVIEGGGDDSVEALTERAALALEALALKLPPLDPFRRPVGLLAQGLSARLPSSRLRPSSPAAS
jgi:hypothetical protein